MVILFMIIQKHELESTIKNWKINIEFQSVSTQQSLKDKYFERHPYIYICIEMLLFMVQYQYARKVFKIQSLVAYETFNL